MTNRLCRALISSLAVHVILVWLVTTGNYYEYGVWRPSESRGAAVMHVQLIDAALRRGLEVPSELVGDEIDPSVVPKSVSLSDRGGASPDNSPAAIDYLPIGRLTRAPVLLSDINLDVAGVNDLAFSGQLEFDLFVDADGSVARIEVAAETELERRFSERVVQHFKAARFRPGEVDGKVSASLLRIVVVSGKPTSDDGMR